ncbi:glycerate kinase [Streptococcus zalophi]|uniref:Glycerate kinase n=1 Tax=Streptococcus zalophi TaxID=640031 RepID=A0A934P8U2_9STRE|nr:glycerate kinase [Streptococcus zalophi]MBJ8349055.1 glycerate kinase [Streptococcus zalophi]MCR8967794.1 glycerate kinase [Streptococcus zalophi]
MKIIFASDSFKGSLSSEKISELLEEVTPKVFPHAEMVSLAVADGGEGTMSVLVKALDGSERKIISENPLGKPIEASYGLLSNQTAIIEMARASGLPLINNKERHPMKTSSYGTGLLIRDALDNKVNHILIALGGSATNDGGMGAMSALGIRFLDKNGQLLKGTGEELEQVYAIDVSNSHPRIKDVQFTILSDVTNPLLGKNGATYTFSKQKGADDNMMRTLEIGMTHFSQLVEQVSHKQLAKKEGVGAAGGLAFSLMAFLNAEMTSGIETILDVLTFDEKIKDADFIITGEGQLDSQSAFGKVISGVAKRAKKQDIPVFAIVGSLLDHYEMIYDCGVSSIITTINKPMHLDEALQNSESLYQDAAYRLLATIRTGMFIHQKYKN